MRSPLELLEGRYEHALLTTYSFNLRFFEEWVLRALWAAEVRNVVVLVDRHELGHALADRAPSAAGRAYHVVAARTAKAAFHPKLLLVSGSEGSRLCVSSANITSDGQLRNAESAIAFDSQLAGHTRPILDAGDLFRRLSADVPVHTAAAIQQALAALPEDAGEPSPYRLVHNLDEALIQAFPSAGATRAVAPYVDADGAAARRLHERGSLTVIVDGEGIAASTGFFAGPWKVDARCFDARLHGKAYEVTTVGGRWILVGSPNLSEPALLRTASAGNLEVAVAVSGEDAIELPANRPHHGEDLPQAAAARLVADRERVGAREATGRAFDSWEVESRIVVAGVPDGAVIERWKDESWQPLGTVSGGSVLLEDPEVRPTRIRAVTGDGRVAFAVVTQPNRLRARMRAATSGRQTHAVERLPLDVETVRVLEKALWELYALSELAGEVRSPRPPARPEGPAACDDEPGLLEWMPRDLHEEPRVPSLYTRRWNGEPDALLALVSRVLRLEAPEAPTGEDDVGLEQIGLDELEDITSDEQVEVEREPEDARVPAADPKELEGYRRAFGRLFQRGQTFIASASDPTLAGWAFTYLLRLVEDLGSHHVEVGGRREPLMPRRALRATTLDLLETYLRRGERDLLCLASARVHMAAAIRERSRYVPRDRERLDTLAFEWAGTLVAVPAEVPAPGRGELGLDAAGALAWLEEYAERSDWAAIDSEAADRLEVGWLEREPWPTIVGRVAFSDRLGSPAWALLAFAAPAAFDAATPFGVVLHNSADAPVATHVLVCVPDRLLVAEAFQRSGDGAWVERHYDAQTRGTVERLHGPVGLEPVGKTATHAGFDDCEEPLRTLSPLLAAATSSLG